MGRPLKPYGRKARDHLATMDVDLALAAKGPSQQMRMMSALLGMTDPVQRNAGVRELMMLTADIADHIEDARLEQRSVVEILDEWARLNNGDGP